MQQVFVLPKRFTAMILAACMLMVVAGATLAATPADSIPAAQLVQPADWAAKVKDGSAAGTLTLHVGFKTMYDQAHIPGSEYAGPGNTGAGLQVLRDRVADLKKDAPILIYCGCCPWERCPNMGGAYAALVELGFTNVKAMIIQDNFGSDWVEKGYPVARTE
jgi:thiosulfate/3-mercaptopyruvate sulfurtransferase